MANLDLWMETLQSRISGADQPTLELELKNAIREFSTQSGAFLKQLGPYAYKAGESDYNLNPQPDGKVIWVHAVEGNNKFPLVLVQNETAGRTGMFYAYVPRPAVVRINPVPTEDSTTDEGFTVWAGMVPNLGSRNVQVPDEFQDMWFDHILDGAQFRLYSMHKRPWTNPLSAQYHGRRFRNGMAQARDITRRRFSDAESDFVFPPWGNLPRSRSRW